MKYSFLFLLSCLMGSLFARETAPAAYTFQTPATEQAYWFNLLPKDTQRISDACAVSLQTQTVYVLSELCGLEEGYEVEYILLGKLSDHAYESLAISQANPSDVAKAMTVLNVPNGVPAATLRGLPIAKGERFTLTVATLPNATDTTPLHWESLDTYVTDECSPTSNALFSRGFPYTYCSDIDTLMPAAIVSTYQESISLFGMPYEAPKSSTYGLFRAKTTEPIGKAVVIALHWEKLSMPRVYNETIQLTPELIDTPDTLLHQLKALCDDPRDVFLTVNLSPELTLEKIVPFAKLILSLEQQGGFILDAVSGNQITLKAFVPVQAWRERNKRVFQPWEVELAPCPSDKPLTATLCQIIEDWTVEGNDPKLTRKCYPDLTPEMLLSCLKRVDVNDGKIYVVFFYALPGTTMRELGPFAAILSDACPTQWVFLLDKPETKEVN